ncbi:MAG TPA: feruloyl-CoA synthase [Stellaceae bacterium]|nr:feruloyl-CoA synthase [Stellaceae bacterium]
MPETLHLSAGKAPLRDARLGSNSVVFDHRSDGTVYVRPVAALADYPVKLTDRLEYWATAQPARTFLAQRDAAGAWRRISYAAALAAARGIGEALLRRGLSAERPVMILSGNDIEHALLGLGALYAGVAYAPISPAYSTVSSDFGKLRHIVKTLTPGLVFAASGRSYGAAIEAVVPADTEVVLTVDASASDPSFGRPVTAFDDLLTTSPSAAIRAAHEAIGPDTVAKILFTSGSTGLPKGVINTQRMLCSNQAMLRTRFAFMQDEPLVIVDWLPWNHTFGGNHNVGLVLYNGGTLYIDDGKPTQAGIQETVRNLLEISPTLYFNVPKGYEALVQHLRAEPPLRERFFSRLRMMFYSGAGLAPHVWAALDQVAVETCGERIIMLTGLGATETGPFALCCDKEYSQSGMVGLPVAGCELKLVPVDGKLEARVLGPSITPGYWREPRQTASAFDEEGFYRLGDALKLRDPAAPEQGFQFDGRIAEDFKLATGTWVSVGPLRARFISHFAPYVRDVVIAGLNRDAVTALIFADAVACRPLCTDPGCALSTDAGLRAEFARLLTSFAGAGTGSSTRIVRAMLVDDLPSIDAGEITDKGSINQRAVLAHRAALVDELYAESGDAGAGRVITIAQEIPR